MAVRMTAKWRMEIVLSAGRRVVVVLRARSHPYRRGGSNHGANAARHHGAYEARQWFGSAAAVPRPARTHDDVALEQEHAEPGGVHNFGFAGVRAEGHAFSPRLSPKRCGTDIGRDPDSEYCRGRPNPHHERPNQLEQGNRGEEQASRCPILPVRRKDGEVNHRCAERRYPRKSSSQPAIGLRRNLRFHSSDNDIARPKSDASTSHLNCYEIRSTLFRWGDIVPGLG